MYLAIDTSTTVLSMALAEKNKVVFSVQSYALSKQSENFFGLLDTAMRMYAVSWDHLEGIVVGSGPGSFTGLRIGFSAVKAWMCAYHLPVWPVPSACALFYKYHQWNPRIQCVANAMRDNVYIGDFNSLGRNASGREPRTVRGDSASQVKKIKTSVKMIPRAQWLSALPRASGYLFAGESVQYAQDIRKAVPDAEIVQAVDTPDAGLLVLALFSFLTVRKVTDPSRLQPLYFYPEHWQVKKR